MRNKNGIPNDNSEKSEWNEIDLLDEYVKLKLMESFVVKGNVISIKKGELKVFQDEFDLV